MGAVVDPFAGRGDPLARRDGRGVADDRHQIAVSARLGPENTEAVLGVLEGDPLNVDTSAASVLDRLPGDSPGMAERKGACGAPRQCR